MTTAQCQLQIPQASASATPVLTVGTEFVLHCDSAVANLKNPELRLEPTDHYKLKLLRAEPVASGADLWMVSYVAGDHNLHAVQLVDANQSVILGDIHFSVQSVLDAKEPRKEPFGPMGPLGLHVPWWHWMLWIFFLVGILTVATVWIRKSLKKRKLLIAFAEKSMGQDPYAQFSLRMRGLRRQISNGDAVEATWVRQLDTAFRLYLLREFKAVTLTADEQPVSYVALIKEMKKSLGPLWKTNAGSLNQAVVEIERMSKRLEHSADRALPRDLEQLVELVRKAVDHLQTQRDRP